MEALRRMVSQTTPLSVGGSWLHRGIPKTQHSLFSLEMALCFAFDAASQSLALGFANGEAPKDVVLGFLKPAWVGQAGLASAWDWRVPWTGPFGSQEILRPMHRFLAKSGSKKAHAGSFCIAHKPCHAMLVQLSLINAWAII